jgi:hypothetical protein
MLRTNLSTRPFYNERGVRAGIVALAVLAIGMSVFNVVEILRLQGQSRDARETIARNEAQAIEMRDKARVIRQSIDRTKLDAVQAAAQEANVLIDRRTFSWTELLNQFQATLPPDVRIGGVIPQRDNEGRLLVQISVFSKRVEDLEEFMDALEKTGVFSGVLSRSDNPDDAGLQSQLQAYYTPQTAVAAAPASDSGKGPAANASAGNASAEEPVAPKPPAKAESR